MPALSTQDKGKVERFIRYLRASFYVPLASQLSPEGLKVDCDTANARVGTWLREVANARTHATTGEIPLLRLEQERERLQPTPAPWPGALQPARPVRPAPLTLHPQVFTDPMVGGGTSVEVPREMGIEAHGLVLHWGFNILKQPILEAVGKSSDLVVSHPPYHNIVVYSGEVWGRVGHPDDLSRCATADEFVEKLTIAMNNQRHATRLGGGYYGAIIGDVREGGVYSSYQADLITRCRKKGCRRC